MNEDRHSCVTDREIVRLVNDAAKMQEHQGNMEVMLAELKTKLDAFADSVGVKFDAIINKIDNMTTLQGSFEERLSKLEKALYAIKYIGVGGLISLALIYHENVFGILIKLIGLL